MCGWLKFMPEGPKVFKHSVLRISLFGSGKYDLEQIADIWVLGGPLGMVRLDPWGW